ncbi:MAG: hypothetical protein CMM30_02405 [Rhodospirillaceae bacterium]|nr:hypothetical protein [Alphaproteobacteria bacterium]MBR71778.1 hypothetical protein [Rhodospirillaceae bacterium]|tara:strand:+ start:15708 stop:16382 length:675 start_codon:yes stop_codon:yes gene_type:complete
MSHPPLNGIIIPVTPLQQNCSILWCNDTKYAAVVDPGGEIEKILGMIEEKKLVLNKILVTHAHVDHAGAVAELSDRLNIPIFGPHFEDQFWIDQIEEAGKQYGIPSARKFTPNEWLEDGASVNLGNLYLDVYHCPGHTPGHIIFHHPASKLAAVGDVLFQGSIGRSDFPRGDMNTLLTSIQEKLWPLGNETTFIPGHGPLSTFGAERKTNPFVADHLISSNLLA